MNYIQNCVTTLLIIPFISIAMSEESQKCITVINKTPFSITVVPRAQDLNSAGRFCMNPQNNHKVDINPEEIKSVTSFPSGAKQMAFFLLTVHSHNNFQMPFFIDKNSNTITVGNLEKTIFVSKTKSWHTPTPAITFLQGFIDK